MVSEIASFISAMNLTDENYVGYCGTDSLEIESTIQGFDIPVEDAFFFRHTNGKISSLLGFDVNLSENEAEVWGPFVDQETWHESASILWTEAQKKLASSLKSLNFFFESKNKRAIDFALSLGAKKQTENSILTLSSSQDRRHAKEALTELSPEHKDSFVRLHDSLFPSSYLSGQEIYDLMDQNNKVFILEKERKLVGYIYVEARPDHGESTIHFFGVEQNSRGKGFGEQLLTAGVEFLFRFARIKEITLCVESQNRQAIHLYERIGFTERHRCIHLALKKQDGPLK